MKKLLKLLFFIILVYFYSYGILSSINHAVISDFSFIIIVIEVIISIIFIWFLVFIGIKRILIYIIDISRYNPKTIKDYILLVFIIICASIICYSTYIIIYN